MTHANMWTEQAAGTASYPTGGFVITTGLASVVAFDVEIADPDTDLGQVEFVYTLNTPVAGQVTVKVLQAMFKLLSLTTVTGLPGGVTAESTSGETVADETAHTHTITHGHGTTAASGTMYNAIVGNLITASAIGATNHSTHAHTATINSAAFTSGGGVLHNHTWDNIYQHIHTSSTVTTDTALVELPNATDISSALFNYSAVDQ